MDPTLIKTVKLAHHASEQLHQQSHEHPLDPKKDGIVDPIMHGLENMPKPAFWMAVSLTAFTAVLKIASLVFGVPDPISAVSPLASFGVSALAGAIWGSATGFYQGYTHASEHNDKVLRGLPDPEFERTHARKRTVEKALTHTPRKGMIAHGAGISSTLHEQEAPATVPTTHEQQDTPHSDPTHIPAPRHVKKILEEGPRSLSPKEVAQRIHEQRTAGQQVSV